MKLSPIFSCHFYNTVLSLFTTFVNLNDIGKSRCYYIPHAFTSLLRLQKNIYDTDNIITFHTLSNFFWYRKKGFISWIQTYIFFNQIYRNWFLKKVFLYKFSDPVKTFPCHKLREIIQLSIALTCYQNYQLTLLWSSYFFCIHSYNSLCSTIIY